MTPPPRLSLQKTGFRERLLAKFLGQGISTAMAEFMAAQSAEVAWKIWGGQEVYFCRGRKLRVNKDLIWEEFNGRNHEALAQKYHCSVRWVEKIVAARIHGLKDAQSQTPERH